MSVIIKVTIKSFDVAMEVKNKGIEFGVRSRDGEHLGDVVLTKSGLVWCTDVPTRRTE